MLVNSGNSTVVIAAASTFEPVLGWTNLNGIEGGLITLNLPSANVTANEKTRVYVSCTICFTASLAGNNFLAITKNGNALPGLLVVSGTIAGPTCLNVEGLVDVAYGAVAGAADVLAPQVASSVIANNLLIFSSAFTVFEEAAIGPVAKSRSGWFW